MTIKSKRIDIQEYKELVEDTPLEEPSLFHNSLWLDTISESFGAEKVLIKSYENDRVLAITPMLKKKRFIFSFYGSSLSGLYSDHMGVLFRQNISKENKIDVINNLTSWLRKRADYLEFQSYRHFNQEIYESLLDKKFKVEKKNTLIIDLNQGKDLIWKGFEGRARTEIRKAKKNSIEVKEEVPNYEWSLNFYTMLTETFNKRGEKCPHPFSFFNNLEKIFHNGSLKVFSAYKDEVLVASSIFLIDRNRMIYSSGTSNIIGMKNSANSLIQWEAINKAISIGLEVYDLGGIGIESIDKFKKSFSKEEINNFRWVYRTRLIKLLEPISRKMAKKGMIKF